MMHLAAFVSAGPVSGIHGGWRHPAADRNILAASYYANIARTLEQGCFDLLFMADILAVPDRLHGSMDSQLRHGALGALRLDPLLVLASLAGATRHLGLACTVSTTYFPPYQVARALATLDHLSAGRAAWNIVTSFQAAEARNFGLEEHLSRDARYDRADEFVDVCGKLWDSWSDDALVLDPAAPLYADPARVRRVDHEGAYFKVRGPLNVSRSPQGRPVYVQAGASDRGRDFAARWAEVVFITPPPSRPPSRPAPTSAPGQRSSAGTPPPSRSFPASAPSSPRPAPSPRNAAASCNPSARPRPASPPSPTTSTPTSPSSPRTRSSRRWRSPASRATTRRSRR